MSAPKKKKIPLAELHAHIEGTIHPDVAEQKAAQNGVVLPDWLIRKEADGTKSYVWKSFVEMVTISYDAVASSIQSAQDYEDITYDYLKRCAEEGSIYEELIISGNDQNSPPSKDGNNTKLLQVPYDEMLKGVVRGIDRARHDFGIEARLSAAVIRHMGEDAAQYAVDQVVQHLHPYVTSFDVAGAETPGDLARYERFIDQMIDHTNGQLGFRMHVMEATGPQMGWDALAVYDRMKAKHGDKFKSTIRFGHGVRVVEDKKLMAECKKRGVHFEVCPSSNVKIGVYDSYEKHPLREMYDYGLDLSLGSDDPPHFHCTIGGEYKIAKEKFGMSDDDLINITRMALKSAFVDEPTRAKLLAKLPPINKNNLTRGKGMPASRRQSKKGAGFRP